MNLALSLVWEQFAGSHYFSHIAHVKLLIQIRNGKLSQHLEHTLIHRLCWLDSSGVTNYILPAKKFSLLVAFLRVPGLSSCVIYAACLDTFDASGKLLKMTRHLSLMKAKPLGLLNGPSAALWGRRCFLFRRLCTRAPRF